LSDQGKGETPNAPPAWFFVEEGKVVGPMTADELAACVRAGRVARETLVAPSGSSAWVSAGQIDGLLTAQRPTPVGDATVVSAPPAHDLATSEGLDGEDDDVATSDTLGDAVARGTGPRRARTRARSADAGEARTGGRGPLIIGLVVGVVVIGVIVALLMRRATPPAEPAPVAARPLPSDGAHAPSDVASASAPAASSPAPATDAATATSSTDAPSAAARSGVVTPLPPGAPPDAGAVASARDAASAEVDKLQAGYQSQVSSFASAGGLDPAKLRTAADVDARLQQVSRLRQENLAVERALLDIAQGLRARLESAGVPEAEAAALARTMQADLRITPLVQACRLEDEAWAASDDLLATLRGSLGHWRVRSDGDLEFDSSVPPATYANYSAAVERVQAAARGQQALAPR